MTDESGITGWQDPLEAHRQEQADCVDNGARPRKIHLMSEIGLDARVLSQRNGGAGDQAIV